MGLEVFVVFSVPKLIDDMVELEHDMKQLKENFNMGDPLLDRQDRGIPHIHLQLFPLIFVNGRKELFQGLCFSVFVHPEDLPRQVEMAFADKNLVDGQDTKPIIVGLALFFFQEPLVNGFDRFPIQLQMPSYPSDGENLAQLVDGVSQSFVDLEIRIEQTELFDGSLVVLRLSNLSVLASDPDSGRSKIEILKKNRFSWLWI